MDSSRSTDSAHGHVVPPTIGKYECIRVLGAGANGVVWKAFDTHLRRVVALKLLRSSSASRPQARARFKSEARAGARLRHPNIVAVFDADEHEGELFIAQELVGDARTLTDWIAAAPQRRGSAQAHFRAAAQIAAAIGDALEVAHVAGIVHRDVKPSNVLITSDDQPKLADFGIAHLDDAESATATGDVRGTPAYMSPEQIDRALGPIDARSDVYGLGATLFDLLTLTRPFDSDSPIEIMRRAVQEGARDPREARADVPSDLAAICLKAMSRTRERRYGSARELADDLRRWLRNEAVLAKPPTVWSRGHKWSRRHPVLALGAAAAVLLLVVISWFAYELKGEAERAKRQALLASKAADAVEREAGTRLRALTLALDLLNMLEPGSSEAVRVRAQDAVVEIVGLLDSSRVRAGAEEAGLAQSAAKFAERWAFYEQARELLVVALRIFESLEAGEQDALGARASLGGILLVLGEGDEAHSQLAAAVHELEKLPSPNALALCAARTNLAGERFSRGQPESAVQLLRSALRDHAPALSVSSDPVLRTQYLYAAILVSTQQPWLAAVQLEQMLERCASAGKGAGNLANTARSTLGALFNSIGDYDCAERELAPARERLAHELGANHPNTLTTSVNLADAFTGLGRHAEALAIQEHVLAARQRTLRPNDPALLSMHSSVGLSLVRLGRCIEAEPHLRQVVEHKDEIHLTGTDVKSNARCNLALLLVETERFDEGAVLAHTEFVQRTSLRGRQDRDRLFAMEVFVRALWGQRNLEEAPHLARLLVEDTPVLARERAFREGLLREIQAGLVRPLEASAPLDR